MTESDAQTHKKLDELEAEIDRLGAAKLALETQIRDVNIAFQRIVLAMAGLQIGKTVIRKGDAKFLLSDADVWSRQCICVSGFLQNADGTFGRQRVYIGSNFEKAGADLS